MFAISPVQVVDWESEILHKKSAQVKPSPPSVAGGASMPDHVQSHTYINKRWWVFTPVSYALKKTGPPI